MQQEMQICLAERIQQVRDRLGKTSLLAEKTGISTSYINRLINSEVENPGIKQIMKIARAGGVSVQWLLEGGEESSAMPVVEEIKGDEPLRFSQLIKAFGKSIKAWCYTGDTIRDFRPGDWLLADIENTAGDGIYLVDFGGGITARRVIWQPGNQVNVVSDNDLHGNHTVPVDQLNIIGKVVWAGIRV